MSIQPATLRQSGSALLLALLLAATSGLAFQGARGLYDPTEGRYAECARQMVVSGDYLTPRLNGEGHWTKPPMTYWSIAAGLRLLGVNAWGARLGFTAAFVLTVLLVGLSGCALWDRATGGWAALVYATSPFVALMANVVNADTLLTLWEALAIFGFVKALASGAGRWMVVAWLGFALGFMTKGPPALLPLLAMVPTHIVLKRRGQKPPAFLSPAGLVLFLGVGFSWYLFQVLRQPHLLEYWLKDEIVNRFSTNEFDRHPDIGFAFAVYLPELLLGTGFWLAFAAANLRGIGPRWGERVARWVQGEDWRVGFLLLLIVPQAIIFSASLSKAAGYVLPLFVPMCLLLGLAVRKLLAMGRITPRGIAIAACATSALVVFVKFGVARFGSEKDSSLLAASMQPYLDDQPGAKLYSLGHHPPLGVQFHLQREIEVANLFGYKTDILGPNAGVVPLAMLESRHVSDVKGNLKDWRLKSVQLHGDWALLIPRDNPSHEPAAAPPAP